MTLHNIPHLTTARSIPLLELEKIILKNQIQIEAWFRNKWQQHEPPFYASVDLRNAGFKIAPVDTNLFPAGFNNINPDLFPLCICAVQNTLERNYPRCQRILIIPESHTRNLFYLENVVVLEEILKKAGFDVRVGSLMDLPEPQSFSLPSQRTLTLWPAHRSNNRLVVENFDPCLILLNHDLSSGVPEILTDIQQPILPPLAMGWERRLKSQHFLHYQHIVADFCQGLSMDPWLIAPIFRSCGEVDFQNGGGFDELSQRVEEVYAETEKKYATYDVKEKPFVVVKADNGTYGMGVLMLHSPSDLQTLTRKDRTRMSTSKGGQKIRKVIIQEGVYTFETIGPTQSVAEPVVYMIGKQVVGGFYRVHINRGIDENLNAPGMHFEPLAFAKPCNTPALFSKEDEKENRFYVYGVIARLAMLAAAYETGDIHAR